LIRAIRKIRIQKAFSFLVPALACLRLWQGVVQAKDVLLAPRGACGARGWRAVGAIT
jgi:hypothetical protein